MLRSAICLKPLRDCRAPSHEATDENAEPAVLCYECPEEHKIPFEDEGAEEN